MLPASSGDRDGRMIPDSPGSHTPDRVHRRVCGPPPNRSSPKMLHIAGSRSLLRASHRIGPSDRRTISIRCSRRKRAMIWWQKSGTPPASPALTMSGLLCTAATSCQLSFTSAPDEQQPPWSTSRNSMTRARPRACCAARCAAAEVTCSPGPWSGLCPALFFKPRWSPGRARARCPASSPSRGWR